MANDYLTACLMDVFRIARDEAVNAAHATIDIGHLILALVVEPQGAAGAALRRAGLDEAALRLRLVSASRSMGSVSSSRSTVPFAPSAALILRSAAAFAAAQSQERVGSGHVLWAIAESREAAVAARRLRVAKAVVRRAASETRLIFDET